MFISIQSNSEIWGFNIANQIEVWLGCSYNIKQTKKKRRRQYNVLKLNTELQKLSRKDILIGNLPTDPRNSSGTLLLFLSLVPPAAYTCIRTNRPK